MRRGFVMLAFVAMGGASCGGGATKAHDASADDAPADAEADRDVAPATIDGAAEASDAVDLGSTGADGSDGGDAVEGPSDGADSDAGPRNEIFVSPTGSDTNLGTADAPVQTLQRAQALIRSLNANMTSDLRVVLADGYYRMTSPLVLDASDSGTGGHAVVWTAADGARPVLVGSKQIKGWSEVPGSNGIWMAQGPPGLKTRQLYVAGKRATRAAGTFIPAPSTLMAWRDPSGATPAVEMVYTGGNGAWSEARCPVASATVYVITMAEPCWDNSTMRDNGSGLNLTGPPTRAENAYVLLDLPGEWYLDEGSGKVYYIPLAGQVLEDVDVEAPFLEALVTGGGTATAPLHDVTFQGLQFSYATWMGPSSPNGFPEVQANYLLWGPDARAASKGEYIWSQIPANVTLTYAQNVRFSGNAFVHLGAAGLALGNGVQSSLVEGNVFTDISGNPIELGNVDMRNAVGADQTLGNTLKNNHVFESPVEYHGGVGIVVGYAANTTIVHNQVDHTPYTGISIGWGGWPDSMGMPGLSSYAHDNDVSFNLIFDVMELLNDGGGIYTNGQTSSSGSYATGQTIKGNVIHDVKHPFWAIYVDNGTDWITVTGNAVWNPVAPFGFCHMDYYPGEGGGYDNLSVQGNYFQGAAGGSADAHCQITGNVSITGPADVPKSILDGAGIEPAFASVLTWTEAPPPPAH